MNHSFRQDAENVRQQRSRIVQTLNVPLRVRIGPSLAAALLGGLFDHPVRYSSVVLDVQPSNFHRAKMVFP
jgi:hypothetical protein